MSKRHNHCRRLPINGATPLSLEGSFSSLPDFARHPSLSTETPSAKKYITVTSSAK
jgi:hypothetical protein